MHIRQTIPRTAQSPVAMPAALQAIAAACLLAAIALTLSATVGKADPRVLLTPTADAGIDQMLAENLTLPLLLDTPELAEQDLSSEIEAEASRMTALLREFGYLTGRIEVAGKATKADPLTLAPVTGPLFRIGWIGVEGLALVAPEVARSITALVDDKIGETATATVLDDIRDSVLSALRSGSYGHAVVPPPALAIEPRTSTAGVHVMIRPGDALIFGDIRITGSFRLTNAEAATFLPYRPGDPYSGEAIAALRAGLEDTNQFKRVRIELGATPNMAGQTDVYVELRDRAPDVTELDRSSGIGPKLLIATMLIVILMECLRVTPLWSNRALRRIVTFASLGMIAVSAPLIALRLASFLG